MVDRINKFFGERAEAHMDSELRAKVLEELIEKSKGEWYRALKELRAEIPGDLEPDYKKIKEAELDKFFARHPDDLAYFKEFMNEFDGPAIRLDVLAKHEDKMLRDKEYRTKVDRITDPRFHGRRLEGHKIHFLLRDWVEEGRITQDDQGYYMKGPNWDEPLRLSKFDAPLEYEPDTEESRRIEAPHRQAVITENKALIEDKKTDRAAERPSRRQLKPAPGRKGPSALQKWRAGNTERSKNLPSKSVIPQVPAQTPLNKLPTPDPIKAAEEAKRTEEKKAKRKKTQAQYYANKDKKRGGGRSGRGGPGGTRGKITKGFGAPMWAPQHPGLRMPGKIRRRPDLMKKGGKVHKTGFLRRG